MTVQTETSRVSYTGAGTTGPFTIPFYFLANADIRVVKQTISTGAETELALTTDFTLTGAGEAAGGELTLVASLSSDYKLVIFRDPEILQETAYPRNDPFPAESHERAIDRLTMIAQRQSDLLGRAIRLSEGDVSGASMVLPAKVDRVSKTLGFDSTGAVTVYDPDSAVTAAGNVTFSHAETYSAGTVGAKLKQFVSVLDPDFEALGDGSTNDAAAFAAAVAAVSAGGELTIPAGYTFLLGSQITINKAMTIRLLGTVKPHATTGSAGTALFKITASRVSFIGEGVGVIDGISSTYSNWNGIAAESTTGFLENITVSGLRFQNIAIDNTSAAAISFASVKYGQITKNTLYNVGVVGNVSGGGFGIYSQWCDQLLIEGNQGELVGSSFINESCGYNNRIVNNSVRKATLFGFKGGYGLGPTITNDAAPSTTAFTVTKNAANTKQLIVGQAFAIPKAALPYATGTIKSITDNTTYYTVTTQVAMAVAPTVGDQIQTLSTNTILDGNQVVYSGENGFDQNGVHNMLIRNNSVD